MRRFCITPTPATCLETSRRSSAILRPRSEHLRGPRRRSRSTLGNHVNLTSESDRRLLLQLAREAMAAHVASAAPPVPDIAGVLARPCGVFVTIHNHGDLRGCIGHLEADE